MASNRFSSNSPDVIDVAAVMEAFQTINKVELSLIGKVDGPEGRASLTFWVHAHDRSVAIWEAQPLASVKCNLGFGGYKTMESAIMSALYQIDWELAKRELEGTKKTA